MRNYKAGISYFKLKEGLKTTIGPLKFLFQIKRRIENDNWST